MLIVGGLIRWFLETVLFAAALLIPAGTWHWPRGVQFLVAFRLLALIVVIALERSAPASLEARAQRGGLGANRPTADRVVSVLIGVFTVAWFVFIPVDVHHLRLLPPPPPWLAAAGGLATLAGFAVMTAAMWQNAFAAPVVAAQTERGHVVVESGLDGLVRHPMYLGHLLFLIGMALWLGSFAALVVLPAVVAPLIGRILIEESTPRKTLPGYPTYMASVRSRLVPGIWSSHWRTT